MKTMSLSSLLKSALSIASLAAVVASSAVPAMANFAAIHKFTGGGKTYVYFPNTPAGTTKDVFYFSAATPKVLTLNNCGWGKLKESATAPLASISGNGITWDAMTSPPIESGAAPTCVANTASPGTYTDSNPNGTLLKTTDGYVWMKGGAGPGSLTATIVTRKTIKVKGNDCNWGKVTVSDTRPMTSFIADGGQKALASLPAVTGPMVCRAPVTGAAKINYVPQ